MSANKKEPTITMGWERFEANLSAREAIGFGRGFVAGAVAASFIWLVWTIAGWAA